MTVVGTRCVIQGMEGKEWKKGVYIYRRTRISNLI